MQPSRGATSERDWLKFHQAIQNDDYTEFYFSNNEELKHCPVKIIFKFCGKVQHYSCKVVKGLFNHSEYLRTRLANAIYSQEKEICFDFGFYEDDNIISLNFEPHEWYWFPILAGLDTGEMFHHRKDIDLARFIAFSHCLGMKELWVHKILTYSGYIGNPTVDPALYGCIVHYNWLEIAKHFFMFCFNVRVPEIPPEKLKNVHEFSKYLRDLCRGNRRKLHARKFCDPRTGFSVRHPGIHEEDRREMDRREMELREELSSKWQNPRLFHHSSKFQCPHVQCCATFLIGKSFGVKFNRYMSLRPINFT